MSVLQRCMFCVLFVLSVGVATADASEPNVVELKREDGRNGRWLHCATYCSVLDIQVIHSGFGSQQGFSAGTPLTTTEVYDFKSDVWKVAKFKGLDGQLDALLPKTGSCWLTTLEDSQASCSFSIVLSTLPRPSRNGIKHVDVYTATLKPDSLGDYTIEYQSTLPAGEQSEIPRWRDSFAAASNGIDTYMYGGSIAQEDGSYQVFGDLWRLQLSSSETQPTKLIATWTILWEYNIHYEDSTAPNPRSFSALAVLDSSGGPTLNFTIPQPGNETNGTVSRDNERVTIVLSGGSVLEPARTFHVNDLWLFDLTEQTWELSKPASSKSDLKFSRSYHSMVAYKNQLYVYGGYYVYHVGGSRQGQFPRNLLQTSPFNKENPQESCDQENKLQEEDIGLWCEYKKSGDLPQYGYAGQTCLLRDTFLVCTFGLNLFEHDNYASIRMQMFNLPKVEQSLVVADESVSTYGEFTTVTYMFLIIFVLGIFLVCLSSERTRRAWRYEAEFGQYPRANRVARHSLIKRLPLVKYHVIGKGDGDSCSTSSALHETDKPVAILIREEKGIENGSDHHELTGSNVVANVVEHSDNRRISSSREELKGERLGKSGVSNRKQFMSNRFGQQADDSEFGHQQEDESEFGHHQVDESEFGHHQVDESEFRHHQVGESEFGHHQVDESEFEHHQVDESEFEHHQVDESEFGNHNPEVSEFKLEGDSAASARKRSQVNTSHDSVRRDLSNPQSTGELSSIHGDESETCTICIEEFQDGEWLRMLPCKHVYHPECVDKWLATDKSCPLCKQDIDKFPFDEATAANNQVETEIVGQNELVDSSEPPRSKPRRDYRRPEAGLMNIETRTELVEISHDVPRRNRSLLPNIPGRNSMFNRLVPVVQGLHSRESSRSSRNSSIHRSVSNGPIQAEEQSQIAATVHSLMSFVMPRSFSTVPSVPSPRRDSSRRGSSTVNPSFMGDVEVELSRTGSYSL